MRQGIIQLMDKLGFGPRGPTRLKGIEILDKPKEASPNNQHKGKAKRNKANKVAKMSRRKNR